jgi:hypothetical protein
MATTSTAEDKKAIQTPIEYSRTKEETAKYRELKSKTLPIE